MGRFVVTALILGCFVCAFAFQEELPTVDEIMSRLKAGSDQLRSIDAVFVQEEKNEFGEIVTTEGKFYFLSPGRYLINSIMDGKILEEMGKNKDHAWRIRHHLKTIDRFKVRESEQASEGFLFTDAEELNAAFDLKLVGIGFLDSGRAYHLKGKAKEKRKIREVEIWVNIEKPSPIVKAISYQRRKTTTITFSAIKRNEDVETGMFNYKVPRGYDEIIH